MVKEKTLVLYIIECNSSSKRGLSSLILNLTMGYKLKFGLKQTTIPKQLNAANSLWLIYR